VQLWLRDIRTIALLVLLIQLLLWMSDKQTAKAALKTSEKVGPSLQSEGCTARWTWGRGS